MLTEYKLKIPHSRSTALIDVAFCPRALDADTPANPAELV